jgi:hypothetical protein
MRAVPTMTPPCVARAPPESPVPAPRGTTGIRAASRVRSTSDTSSAERGRTTALGETRYWVRPSDSYTRSRSASSRKPAFPTIPRRRSATPDESRDAGTGAARAEGTTEVREKGGWRRAAPDPDPGRQGRGGGRRKDQAGR